MSFLAPGLALLTAGLAVPALVLLYLLKLRRRILRVPSTMLWTATRHDLQVNAPWARFRPSMLFLLQLLALLALLAALAQPVVPAPGLAVPRLVLLIDCSASMNVVVARDAATGAAITRLDRARALAEEIIDSAQASTTEVLLVSFADRARVLSGFETRGVVLRAALRDVEPTDAEADLRAAVELAAAFARPTADGAEAAEIVVLSDGGVRTASRGAATAAVGSFRYVPIGLDGDAPRNVGVAQFTARRDFRTPTEVSFFGRLVNAGAEEAEVACALLVDGESVASRAITVPAATDEPGRAEVTFTIPLERAADVMLRCASEGDQLDADDAAVIAVPAPPEVRIAIVHGDDGADPWLVRALRELADDGSVRTLPRAAYVDLAARAGELRQRFDLVVFDGVADVGWPPIPSLSFGGAPDEITVRASDAAGGERVLSWDRSDAMMRHVSLDQLVFGDAREIELPVDARVLARSAHGAIIAALEREAVDHVVVGYRMSRSNWPGDLSVAIFMQNVVDQLARPSNGGTLRGTPVGATITVRVGRSTERIEVIGPRTWSVDVSTERATRWPLTGFDRAGRYEIRGAAPPVVAVSMLSPVESDIRVRDGLDVTAGSVVVGTPEEGRRALWPLLVIAALVILTVEWLWYGLLRRSV